MDATQARALLQLPRDCRPADIQRAFRHQVRHAHPDGGGDPAHFHSLVQAREVLRRTATRPPAPVIVVPDQPWWQPLARLWSPQDRPPTRRVI